MTKVTINPGICNLNTKVSCTYDEDENTVNLNIKSACPHIAKINKELGNEFDPYEICLGKPGTGPLYEYAKKNCPGHCSCPTISGIIKCVEVSSRLALPKDVAIHFEEE